MYVYLKGILVIKTLNSVIIDNSGIGYYLSIGAETYSNMPEPGDEVQLYTYHNVREDSEELFGFFSESEKSVFEALIAVNGIGPSKAINILSNISTSELVSAVLRKDISSISSVKGVGKKTAEKILLDMKDIAPTLSVPDGAGILTQVSEDAVNGLVVLGWKDSEARRMVTDALKRLSEDSDAQTIIKEALKNQ